MFILLFCNFWWETATHQIVHCVYSNDFAPLHDAILEGLCLFLVLDKHIKDHDKPAEYFGSQFPLRHCLCHFAKKSPSSKYRKLDV